MVREKTDKSPQTSQIYRWDSKVLAVWKKAPLWRNAPQITWTETIKKDPDRVHIFSIVTLPQQIRFIQVTSGVCTTQNLFLDCAPRHPQPEELVALETREEKK